MNQESCIAEPGRAKARYASRVIAEAMARVMIGMKRYTYQCANCQGWHITTERPRKRKRR